MNITVKNLARDLFMTLYLKSKSGMACKNQVLYPPRYELKLLPRKSILFFLLKTIFNFSFTPFKRKTRSLSTAFR